MLRCCYVAMLRFRGIQYFTTTTITEKVDFPTEVDYHMYIYLSIP